MPVVNATIAAVFDEIADLLEIEDANPFRIRAYRNAARTLGQFGTDMATLIAQGRTLPRIPGIGEDLTRKILEIVATGRCEMLERLRREVPSGITDLLHIRGLGPKRVRALWHDLGVRTPGELVQAARAGRIRTLHGFGEKTEHRLAEAASAHLGAAKRYPWHVAAQHAEPLRVALSGVDGVERVEVAGSYRRLKETVGDLDMLVVARPGSDVMERLLHASDVQEVLAGGPKRATVILASGLQVDVRVVAPESFGAALQYFTGSRAHNIALRRMAQSRGLLLNEYGLFRGRERIAGGDEEAVYAALGLPWIPPELREDRGEIEAATVGRLPSLVTLGDLRGDLHCHTRASDGHDSIEAMALAARARGLEYLAITDHSRSLGMVHGVDAVGLARQCNEIRRVNAGLSGITVLSGIEVDVLADGTLDLPDTVLTGLDIVVAAVHSRLDLPRAKQTARILRALENPFVRILAHPRCRWIGEREAIDADLEAIFRKAAERGVALEVNAQPQRLDLPDIDCQLARREGVPLVIGSDAHATADLDVLRFGIGQARRGWLEAADILNSRNLRDLHAKLRPIPAAR